MTAITSADIPAVEPCPEWCSRSARTHSWHIRGGTASGLIEGTRTHLRSLGTVAEYRVRLDHFECFEIRVGKWVHLDIGKPSVSIGEWDNLTPRQARKLAALLIEAADIIEGAS